MCRIAAVPHHLGGLGIIRSDLIARSAKPVSVVVGVPGAGGAFSR
jgi:hypothetical protein